MTRVAWIALSAVPGLGPARFRQLVDAFGGPLAALEAGPEEMRARARLPETVARRAAAVGAKLESLADQLLSLEEQGVRALTWEDPEYSSLLLSTSSPPPVLWHTGGLSLANPKGTIAVVGSRQASPDAVRVARQTGYELADRGVTVASGLAAGVDAAAHEGALEARGPTIGVCGCGLITALARGHDGLAGRVAQGGALSSELAPTAPLVPQALHARDRIVAGLACAVVVVEARAEGGAVHTAKCAMKEGRPVFAAEWPAGHRAPGNRQLLAEGAIPFRPEDDVAAAFDSVIEGRVDERLSGQ
jgi:DNA processing protein